MQLVFVGFGVVQHLHVAALHAHGQPLPSGAVTQREDLREKWESRGQPPLTSGDPEGVRSHHSLSITSHLLSAKPSSAHPPPQPDSPAVWDVAFHPHFVGEEVEAQRNL